MGVFSAINKIPRKVRKAIRRSISGVCMVSALIVALVPAEVSRGYTSPGTVSTTDYSYGVADSDITPVSILNSGSVDLTLYSSGAITDTSTGTINAGDPDVYKVLQVRRISDGTYNVNWQFKLYLQSVNGVDMGVICQYNSTYPEGTVSIDPTMPYEYCVVEKSYFDDFFAAFETARNANTTYPTIKRLDNTNYTPTSGKALLTKWSISTIETSYDTTYDQFWIEKYFPTEYTTWKTNKEKYDKYVEDYTAWQATDQSTPAPATVTDPGALTCYIADMTDTNRYKYFCVACPDYKDLLTAEEYTLVPVADSRNGSVGASINYVYMPQGTPSMYDNDDLGFHINAKTFVIAVGNEAFKETTNVQQLDLCSEIKYIGDEAFMNSFVKAVTFENVKNIGNRAFKGCSELKTMDLKDGAVNIGAEAFYGCGFTDLTFPYSIEYVGLGAFANCTKLAVLDMSKITRDNCEIDDFAFYDCIRLNAITFADTISRIGECAFACKMGVSGMLNEFTFPDHISGMVTRKTGGQANGIGNFCLAGRTNLQYVNMPADYGKSEAVELPYGVFYNCTGLKKLNLPDTAGACGYLSFQRFQYGTDLDGTKLYRTVFDTVMTPDFYVYGPEKDMAGAVASPRKSTWGLKTGMGNDVPYVYKDMNGDEQFEISDGKYTLIIDDNGVLQSCQFANDSAKTDAQVNGLDLVIPEIVGKTKVTGISTDCFSNTTLRNTIKTITIADNSISEIAESAFKDCPMLEKVSIGNSVTKIGASAFENCPNLTYVNFETPKSGYSSFPVENIGANAFSTGAKSLIFEGDINEAYGPFVWATDVNNYVDESEGIRVCYYTGSPTYLTVIVDNRNGLATLVDYPHYDQLNEKSGTKNDAHPLTERYEKLGQEDIVNDAVVYTYDVSVAEENLINAVLHVNIPAGIESIDAYGFINNTSKEDTSISGIHTNNKNVFTYIANASSPVYSEYYSTYRKYGLFNGLYGDQTNASGDAVEYTPGTILANAFETIARGNDRIESVTLNTVTYLPDNAFYSCEKLNNISLGSALEEMDNAPFAGCSNLTSIGSTSSKYICYNGIVYYENTDGSYTILEVLSSRGDLVGSSKIKVSDEDPYLSKVSAISPGAFENCTAISSVDLRGVNLLTELPDEVFKDCTKLNQVILPENVTSIGHNAMAGCMEGIEVIIYGNEVYMPADTFGTPSNADEYAYVTSKRVVSYKDSAVRKSAADLGADVSEVLDDTCKVQFFDYDGKELSKILYVKTGGSVSLEDIPADPVRIGYTFAGWNQTLTNITTDLIILAKYTLNESEPGQGGDSTNYARVQFFDYDGKELSNVIYVKKGSSVQLEDIPDDPKRSGYTFTGWSKSLKNITADTIVMATYSSDSSGNSGNSGSSGTTGNQTLYTLTVTNGNGSGSYAAGATVIITCTNPPSGYNFSKWVATTDDLTIASVNVAATTLIMPAHEASVEATFKKKTTSSSSTSSNSGSSSNNSNNNNNNNGSSSNNGSSVIVSKPGISNSDLASVTVNGSTDNYIVRISENSTATAAVEKALTNEYGSLDNIKYSAMDITLYDSTGTKKITDYSGLSITITMPIPSVMTAYAGNNKAAGVVNEKLDKLNAKFTSIDGVPCITFTATHFSPYVIYVDTSNLNAKPVVDETPKTGDIQPKWFLVAGLMAISIALFFVKDRRTVL